MTREEYERRKRRIEEETRTAVELVEAGGRVQLRALELVWMTSGEDSLDAPFLPPPAGAPDVPETVPARPAPRRSVAEIEQDVRAALAQCPETFERRDIIDALGYEPDRSTLYRVLRDLSREGTLTVSTPGAGQRGTRYQRSS